MEKQILIKRPKSEIRIKRNQVGNIVIDEIQYNGQLMGEVKLSASEWAFVRSEFIPSLKEDMYPSEETPSTLGNKEHGKQRSENSESTGEGISSLSVHN